MYAVLKIDICRKQCSVGFTVLNNYCIFMGICLHLLSPECILEKIAVSRLEQ